MHDTGIVRPVDSLGRVVIPMELRRTLGIKHGTLMEIHVRGESIILDKHQSSCAICGGTEDEMTMLFDRPICASCIQAIKDKM